MDIVSSKYDADIGETSFQNAPVASGNTAWLALKNPMGFRLSKALPMLATVNRVRKLPFLLGKQYNIMPSQQWFSTFTLAFLYLYCTYA